MERTGFQSCALFYSSILVELCFSFFTSIIFKYYETMTSIDHSVHGFEVSFLCLDPETLFRINSH